MALSETPRSFPATVGGHIREISAFYVKLVSGLANLDGISLNSDE